ncbi:PEP-CTERM sorting domain-containing protein [Myxococcota bacterium]|nr:PEP-CTERM sorting domain-containing protein [Myxococcota bacterium]
MLMLKTSRVRSWMESGFMLSALAMTSMVSTPSLACPLTQDFFNYDDGTYLADLPTENDDGTTFQQGGVSSGATWTSSWENVDETPVDAFVIENGKVEVGDTDGEEFRVEREFDLEEVENLGCPPGNQDPDCDVSGVHQEDAYYTATELTQIEDNHEAYEMSVEFTDSEGVVMAYGIENDGIDEEISPGVFDHSDYFFAVLGDTRVVSDVVAEPDKPNYVFSALYIDDSPGGQETLKVWINPDFTDMLEGIDFDIEINRDLEAVAGVSGDRTTLGDTVAFVATTNEDDMVKTFDDFQIVRDMEMLQSPRIDLGNGDVQDNFVEWSVGSTAADSVQTSFDQSVFIPSIPSRTVTMTMEPIDGSEQVVPFDYTLSTVAFANELRKDGVGAEGGLRLVIDNLFNDGYQIKTFHYQTTDISEVEIWVSEDEGTTWYSHNGSYTPGTGAEAARETMIAFHQSNGAPPVWIEFRPTVAGAFVAFNGLQFIPEPSTGLLVGLGLLGLSRRRCAGVRRTG